MIPIAFEWQMQDIFLSDEEDLVAALRAEWEPFAILATQAGGVRVWLKRQVFVDRSDKATDISPTTP